MRQLPGQLDRSRQRQIAEQRDMGTAYFPATGFGRLQRNDQHSIHPIPMRNPGARSRARPVGICAMKMQCATPETTDMSACTYKPCTVITAPISIPAESALAPRREQFRPSHGRTGRSGRLHIREPAALIGHAGPARQFFPREPGFPARRHIEPVLTRINICPADRPIFRSLATTAVSRSPHEFQPSGQLLDGGSLPGPYLTLVIAHQGDGLHVFNHHGKHRPVC